MKLRKLILASLAGIAMLLVGCADYITELPDAPARGAPEIGKVVRVHYEASGDKYRLWFWGDFSADEISKYSSWPNGKPFEYTDGTFITVDVKLADSPKTISMMVIDGTGSTYVSDTTFNFPMQYSEIYLFPGDTTAYTSAEKEKAIGIYAASFTDTDELAISGYFGRKLKADKKETDSDAYDDINLSDWDKVKNIIMKDKNGAEYKIASVKNNNDKTVKLDKSISSANYCKNAPYTLTIDGDTGNAVNVSVSEAAIDDWFGTEAAKQVVAGNKNMGYHNETFRMWAPLACSVNLLLYKDYASLPKQNAGKEKDSYYYKKSANGKEDTNSTAGTVASTLNMTAEENGFWVLQNASIGDNKYYQYEITNVDGTIYRVADIWNFVASPDSIASQITEVSPITRSNPWNGKDYRDAVIYEMHIRDWSRTVNSTSTGKFIDIVKAVKEGALKDLANLGVTHVQILPMFDYAQTNADLNYNWGYNPYHYNVPEGRYVNYTDGDGLKAVVQMREMIEAFHNAGIAVNMDVVYNHTYGTGTASLYDMTVPGYFYRMTGTSYSNGSGCGNEIATNHAMVKRYVIESLKHWMCDYGINGFRFDLMGLHEKETMEEIYKELSTIDPKVMVYGEPWTGGSSTVKDGMTGAVEVGSYGVGAFDDDFRDAIKGGEFGGFKIGQIQENFNDEGIVKGLLGQSGSNNRNSTIKSGLAIHYVECHDNYTLYDKLAYSANAATGMKGIIGGDSIVSKFLLNPTEEQIKTIEAQEKLAAAYIFLAQGTPFINGGQEFMRTKKGNPDSYSADTKGGQKWTNEPGDYNIDDCNTIDTSFKTKYEDVFNTYKALMKFRKDHDAFRSGGKFVDAFILDTGITRYQTDGSEGMFVVFFNATSEDYTLSDSDKVSGKVFSYKNGSYEMSAEETKVEKISAKSFVILKK